MSASSVLARAVPELLAPAGTLAAVRAAIANGANAVYLGAQKFNARDDGAQLTMDEVAAACTLAHAASARVYLTLNVLVKPHELEDALTLLGDAIDAGVDAAIVQDVGLVRLIQASFPGFEVHGSTQMSVHDVSGARLMQSLGIERVVLARENTVDDIRAIRGAVPEIGLESFVHGALCISYSGQCLMSGLISERSANRGSCAQACRKDYVLRDLQSGTELDRGYLISAKDLAAHDQLAALADAGVGCLKVEGRKKKPEYVATVTKAYRTFLDRLADGVTEPPTFDEVRPLVQIYSRGFTAGMLLGRAGRGYITREQPDNRGHEIGVVVGYERGEVLVEVSHPLANGDGIGFEPPLGARGKSTGFSISRLRALPSPSSAAQRFALACRERVPVGWRVLRTAQRDLMEQARASYAALPTDTKRRKERLDVRVFGSAGGPLKALFTCEGYEYTAQSLVTLAPAQRHALDYTAIREHIGRLGETPFALGALDTSGLAQGLFLPLSELNRLRQEATEYLMAQRDWARAAELAARAERIGAAVAHISPTPAGTSAAWQLRAEVFSVEDALVAAGAGATEIVLDPFLRHPAPTTTSVRRLHEELSKQGVRLRLRTPTIVRPEERRTLEKWLALELPLLTGHAGIAAEFATSRDVHGDYALNVFNQHTAQEFFSRGVRTLALSVELTTAEISDLVRPWNGRDFEVVVYGRPEGMTIEHCVLSAAFDRVPTTCRDLCVQKHTNVELTDPAGYAFPVATDSACRNRLLHSRPIEASEYLPKLWDMGIRQYRMIFNVAGEPVEKLVQSYAMALQYVAQGRTPPSAAIREILGGSFTRGHFVVAV